MANYPDIPKERFQEVHRAVVQSILMFCSQELGSDTLDPDQKESLMVAKQCIESTYEMESPSIAGTTDLIDLFQSNNIPVPQEIPDEIQAEAEIYKIKGNEAMKDNDYKGAVDNYTKAININGRKAIYYCNRAAAYSRLDQHQQAIADCKDAIKLDPQYGKAYGRLGIAYANLNMYREAATAYKKALELDPSNASYESNLRLAEEKIAAPPTAVPGGFGDFDFGGLMNNPALFNIASQVMSDPSFRNIGQQLADHIQQNNPTVLENIRQSVNRPRDPAGGDVPMDGGPKSDGDGPNESAD